MDKITVVNLCRICLENGADLPIFEESDDETCILSKLVLCLKEKIEDIEGYPRFICKLCNKVLDTAYDFINKYKNSCKILENGLEVIKQETDELSSLSGKGMSEEEIEVENIKNEYDQSSSDNDFDLSDHHEEYFKPLEFSLKIKVENDDNSSKATTKKKGCRLKSNTKQNTSNIATSILEGQFAWNGDQCCSSKSNSVLHDKSKLLKPKTESKKRITINIPKIKKPNPPKLCDLCGEVFKSTDKLTVHKKRVHFRSPVKCSHCSRVFVSNYYLKRHVKRKHEEHKTFICAICGKGFAFKGELSNHNRNVHDKHLRPKKQFKCQFCNKIYKCAKSVTVHERSVHTGDRPAVCTVCGSSFYHEEYLREHMRLHTGETPFKCPICGRGYAQRGNMKSHLRIHKKSELDPVTLSKLRPNYLRLLKA
ncbi:unnamed protein product, partial [Brenthis ino]